VKVLFLDIDGVLNSHRTAVAFGAFPYCAVKHRDRFDEVAIRLISGLCKRADVSVVLSSSWRADRNWSRIGPALGLPIVDRTPSLAGPRGEEIAAWLAEHPEVENYAIVDDDNDMLPEQVDRFVRTNHFDGLTWANASRLCELFGVDIHDIGRERAEAA
jgi:hypothetical protein